MYEKEQDELLNQVINKHQGQIKDNKRPKKPAVRRTDGEFLVNFRVQNCIETYYQQFSFLSSNTIHLGLRSKNRLLDDRTVENGKAAPIGAKRPYPTDSAPTSQAEELHIVLLGRTQDRNKQIILKCENDNELPKVGHIKCKFS